MPPAVRGFVCPPRACLAEALPDMPSPAYGRVKDIRMSQVTARLPSPPQGSWARPWARLGATLLALLLVAATPATAQREDPGLQLNCANDFFRLCAGIDPNSPDADRCMNRNRPRLSRECKAAIGDYDRRAASPGARNGSRRPPAEEED